MLSIAYLCGTKGYRPFYPTDTTVPGSETAVIQLTNHWASVGHKVTVFALTNPTIHSGVTWAKADIFNQNQYYDVIILWRQAGFNMFNENPNLKTRLLAMDFHDGGFDTEAFCKNPLSEKIHKLFVKSNFQRSLFKSIPDDRRFVIIPNGIRMDIFSSIPPIKREKHRFSFTSQYDRGLEPFLKYAWPYIRSVWSDAELHVYYGFFGKKDALDRIKILLNQPGVYEHGKVDLQTIAIEKFRSTFHVYLCNVPEIDCIAVRESVLAGCIPILINDYVFKERYGIKLDGDPSSEKTQIEAVNTILGLSYSQIALIRREGLKSPTIIDWSNVSKSWIQNIYKAITTI
jgi:hypothetical protein